MSLDAGATAILEAVGAPALLVSEDDVILAANRRALALLPSGAVGSPLPNLHSGDANDLKRYLNRCRGSSAGLLGMLLLSRDGAIEKHRCRGVRVQLPSGAGVLLTLEQGEEPRFLALSRKVAELNDEVRERRHSEAILAEAVRERDLLLRELQHRVKNNVSMLAGLLQGAERETTSAEAKDVLRQVSLRFGAVAAVQQLVYGAGDLDAIDTKEMIERVAQGAATLAYGEVALMVDAQSLALPIDASVPLALILNELVTNAVKYGRPSTGTQTIDVRWWTDAGHALLTVQDNGPGFASSGETRRASGLGLVRGLLRQLGGSLSVEASGAPGARCGVRFPVPPARQTGKGAS